MAASRSPEEVVGARASGSAAEAHDRADASRDAERIEESRVKDETPKFLARVSARLAQIDALLDDALGGTRTGVNGDGQGEGPRG